MFHPLDVPGVRFSRATPKNSREGNLYHQPWQESTGDQKQGAFF